MPTYGYRCQKCEREFDVWQKMSDPPEAACPVCGGTGRRLFFPAGIVFKGSGFYATDSRAASSASPASSSNGSTPKSSPTKETSSGSKSSSEASSKPTSE